MQTILQIYVFPCEHGEGIIETHCVGHYIVLMMGKMLMGYFSSYEMHYLL
jgi:hypothetical protein